MGLISKLDILRAKLLKLTLKNGFLRDLAYSRSQRILFLSLTALFFYFSVSLFFPMWVLLLGPIIWGVPHLFSSLRYSTLTSFQSDQGKKLILFQSLVWLMVFAYRLSVDFFNTPLVWSHLPLLFEGFCLFCSFLFQIYLQRRVNLSSIFYFLLFSTLIITTYKFPIQTALSLLIGHNYVPLIAWFKSCQNKKDTQVFFFVSLVYIGLSTLIFFGGFEFLYTYFEPQSTISMIDWNFTDIFTPYGAQFSDSAFWFRIASLYAFSQSIHYFLWIKAIPENHQPKQYPPSFKWSLHRLSSDFGSSSLYVMLTLVFLGLAYWLFFEFHLARLVYFSIASYHGFMEISALPFIKSNRMN